MKVKILIEVKIETWVEGSTAAVCTSSCVVAGVAHTDVFGRDVIFLSLSSKRV